MSYVIAFFVAVGLLAYIVAEYFDAGRRDETPAEKRAAAGLESLRQHSPLMLGLIWIAYGLMHFLGPQSPEKQMPQWLGILREPLWGASGALEIALGLFVVDKRWRRVSLLVQLFMLIALAPFVVFLLYDDNAMDDLLREMPLRWARVVLVFHNLLLFVWIHATYKREVGGALAHRVEHVRESQAPSPAPLLPLAWSPVLTVAGVMLAANLAGFGVIWAGPWYASSATLWAMACLAGGALVGFLFGVPRWVAAKGEADGAKRERYEPNTNIEKLSDWLTKMLIGVGLVELHGASDAVAHAADALARGLIRRDQARLVGDFEAQAFAVGVIVYFVVAGMIQGFLLTRMFLTRAWQNAASRT